MYPQHNFFEPTLNIISHHKTISAVSQPQSGSLDGKLTYVVGSTGILIPSMEARIMRDDGTDAGVDEIGELWLRGGNVALGYWNNEKASRETFIDGWVHTGDKFRVDAGGNFWFVLSSFYI